MDNLDGRAPYPVTREQMLTTAKVLAGVYLSAELDQEIRAEEL